MIVILFCDICVNLNISNSKFCFIHVRLIAVSSFNSSIIRVESQNRSKDTVISLVILLRFTGCLQTPGKLEALVQGDFGSSSETCYKSSFGWLSGCSSTPTCMSIFISLGTLSALTVPERTSSIMLNQIHCEPALSSVTWVIFSPCDNGV